MKTLAHDRTPETWIARQVSENAWPFRASRGGGDVGTNGKPSDGRKTTLPSQIGEFAADVAAGRVIVASVDD